jgi:hypothetical protein
MRLREERKPKRTLKGYIKGRRLVGKPRRRRRRRIDAVDRVAKRMLKCKNCRRSAEDRDSWRRRTEEAKAQVGP